MCLKNVTSFDFEQLELTSRENGRLFMAKNSRVYIQYEALLEDGEAMAPTNILWLMSIS